MPVKHNLACTFRTFVPWRRGREGKWICLLWLKRESFHPCRNTSPAGRCKGTLYQHNGKTWHFRTRNLIDSQDEAQHLDWQYQKCQFHRFGQVEVKLCWKKATKDHNESKNPKTGNKPFKQGECTDVILKIIGGASSQALNGIQSVSQGGEPGRCGTETGDSEPLISWESHLFILHWSLSLKTPISVAPNSNMTLTLQR